MSFGSWLHGGSRPVDGASSSPDAWGATPDICAPKNETVDLSAAFDKDDMAADLLLEIRPERTAEDLLPLAPARPVTAPVRLLLHSALFDTRSGDNSDLADRLYRNHFKPATEPREADAPDGRSMLRSCCWPCGQKHHTCQGYSPLPSKEAPAGMETLAPHHTPLPAAPSLRLPAAPYQHLVWTVEPGGVEAAVKLLKWCYTKQLSPEKNFCRRLHFGPGPRDRDVIVELRVLPPPGGLRSSKGSGRAASLTMHAVVMMTGSPYFKARLNAAWAPAAAADGLMARLRACTHRWLGGKQCRRIVLVEHVEDEELELAQAVLCSLYGWKVLPSDICWSPSPLKLLRTLLLASRFQVARCTALCLAALAKRPLRRWDADAVAQLLEMPEEVVASAVSPELSLAELQARARTLIAEQYGNLSAIDKAGPDGTLYLQFMGLPLSAVSAILSSPAGGESEFAARHRSCLALAWLEGQQGRRCSPEQRSMLERTATP